MQELIRFPYLFELPDGCSLVNNVNVEIILEKTKQNDKTQNENSSSEGQTKKMRKRQIQSGKQKRIIIKQVQRLEDGRNNN